MSVYQLEKLMTETRRLAAEYRRTTQLVLPVTSELARFDAMSLLGLDEPEVKTSGVDAVKNGLRYEIKSRVIFGGSKKRQRIGQLHPEASWDSVLLVLYNEDYQPTEIYEMDKATAIAVVAEDAKKTVAKRGIMSVEKFKTLAKRVWPSS